MTHQSPKSSLSCSVVDIPEQPLTAFAGGRYNQVPLMLGALTQEAWMFIFGVYSGSMSTTAYSALILGIFHGAGVSVLKQYPPALFGDKRPSAFSQQNLTQQSFC